MAENRDDKQVAVVTDPRDAEKDINSLRGVLSSRLVTSRTGEILEMHVVASADRHPKQILRDIESTFLAKRGIKIDRRKVSIAQLREESRQEVPSNPGAVSQPRLRFVRLTTTHTPDGGEVHVTLGRGNLQGFGEAQFPLSSGPDRAIAEATVRAVERFIRAGRFDVISVENRAVGRHQGLFVHLEFLTRGQSVPLLGSALVQREVQITTLNATMDAVNRFVGSLPPADGVEWVVGPEGSTAS